MARKIWSLAILLLVSFALVTNWHQLPIANSGGSKSELKHPIVIGYSNWAGWWPWAIAESEDLFTKNGLNVELRWYDDYTESLEDLAAGYIDGNCQTLNDTLSFVNSAVEGEVIVLVNDNSAGNDKIIAAPEIGSVKKLRNQRVAIEAGVVDDFLLTLALEQENMSRDDVEIVDLETGAAVEAFVAEQADAVGAFPPFWLRALQRSGAAEIITSKAFPGAIPDLLVVTQKLVDRHALEVQSLVETWFDILEFMSAQPAKAEQIMSERAGVSREEFQLFKAGTKMFTLQDNLQAFEIGNDMTSMPYAALKIVDYLHNSLRSIDKKPDLTEIFDSSFIKSYAL